MINKCRKCSSRDLEKGIMFTKDGSIASGVSNISNLHFDYYACKSCGETSFFKRTLVDKENRVPVNTNKKGLYLFIGIIFSIVIIIPLLSLIFIPFFIKGLS